MPRPAVADRCHVPTDGCRQLLFPFPHHNTHCCLWHKEFLPCLLQPTGFLPAMCHVRTECKSCSTYHTYYYVHLPSDLLKLFFLFPPVEEDSFHFSEGQTSLQQSHVQQHDDQPYKVLFLHAVYRNIYTDRQISPAYTWLPTHGGKLY